MGDMNMYSISSLICTWGLHFFECLYAKYAIGLVCICRNIRMLCNCSMAKGSPLPWSQAHESLSDGDRPGRAGRNGQRVIAVVVQVFNSMLTLTLILELLEKAARIFDKLSLNVRRNQVYGQFAWATFKKIPIDTRTHTHKHTQTEAFAE